MSESREETLLARYRALPYSRTIERILDEGGTYYVSRYPELPGLSADGATRSEAVKNGEDAFDDYIRARLHWADGAIPEPAGSDRVRRELKSSESRALAAADLLFVGQPVAIVASGLQREIAKDVERGRLPTTKSVAPSSINPLQAATGVGGST